LRHLLQDMNALQPSSLSHVARYLQLDEAFHAELWRLAKSPMLARTIEGAIGLTFAASGAPSETADAAQQGVIVAEYRRAVVEAIEQREGSRAEGLAREYARTARRGLARVVQNTDLFRQMPGASLIRMPAFGQSFR
jgi:GntR family transcriptional regulator of vanillate catabolism